LERTGPLFMGGVPELLVLRLVSGKPMYGYEIVKSIRLVTGEAISLGEGVVYPLLHGLERSGALKTKREKHKGRTRVYYSLTAKGRRRLNRLTGEWERVSGAVNIALEGGLHA